MIIKTYCKVIPLDNYIELKFDPELNMITFVGVGYAEKLCFPTKDEAFEFYFEIIEAMYADKEEVDLEHIQVSYGRVNLCTLKEIIKKKIKEDEPDED